MKNKNVDIFISGAGPAGLLASLSFASLGYSVFCVDPKKPVTQVNDVGADLRTTAFLQPAKSFMESLGLWEKLEPMLYRWILCELLMPRVTNGLLGK